jgi:hypothetical protein
VRKDWGLASPRGGGLALPILGPSFFDPNPMFYTMLIHFLHNKQAPHIYHDANALIEHEQKEEKKSPLLPNFHNISLPHSY